VGRSVDIMSGWQTLSRPMRSRTSIAVLILVLLASTQAGGEEKAPTPAAAPAQIAAPAAPSVEPTVAPLTVKLEPVGPLKLESRKGPAWWTFWVPVIGPLISGLLAYFGVRLSLDFAQRNNTLNIGAARRASEAAIWQKANETELKELLTKLDGFYGPFMQMSQANHLMIEEFRSRQPAGFRTLPKVFDRVWLDSLAAGDRKIVAEVCQKAADLEKFIAEKAGLVDDKVLPYLARASAHFRILHLAHKGELGDDPTNFLRYVYPKSLDLVLQHEVDRLRRRCDALRANPGSRPGPMEPLMIERELALESWPSVDSRIYKP
jgi:hypothetical protein